MNIDKLLKRIKKTNYSSKQVAYGYIHTYYNNTKCGGECVCSSPSQDLINNDCVYRDGKVCNFSTYECECACDSYRVVKCCARKVK